MTNWSLNEKPEALIIGGNENNIFWKLNHIELCISRLIADAHAGAQSLSLGSPRAPRSLQAHHRWNQCTWRQQRENTAIVFPFFIRLSSGMNGLRQYKASVSDRNSLHWDIRWSRPDSTSEWCFWERSELCVKNTRKSLNNLLWKSDH